MARIIEFTGTVLTGPDQERTGLWAVDGKLTFHRPGRSPDLVLDGWVLPGSWTRTATSGSGLRRRRPDDDVAYAQAMTDRDAGTLLVRDAGVVQ